MKSGPLADDGFLALLDDLLISCLGGWLELRGPGEGVLAREGAVGQSHDIVRGVGVGDLGNHAVPDLDIGEAGWIGKHQDGVQGHLGGPYYGLVDGATHEAGFLLGELEFGCFGDDAVCCELAPEVVGTVVPLERAWLGVPLDLGLDLFISLEWGWFVAGHWSTLWGSVGLE